jgi:prepilin-type N-terminal cleavage/methylation domain-containing protein
MTTAPPCSRSRAAYTLVEMVISMAILAILMVALASAVTIAGRAADAAKGPASRATTASETIGQIAGELRTALTFTERNAHAITFTVPDRNNDGAPETIRYAWSGIPGDPLTRTYNGSAPSTFADNVQTLDFSYLFRSVGPAPPPPTTETPEMLLASNDDFAGAGTMTDFGLSSTSWAYQYFKPALPANSLSWKVTRVLVMLRRDTNTGGTVTIQLRNADPTLKPVASVLQEITFAASSMSTTYNWTQVSFTAVSGLDPAAPLCVVVGMKTSSGKPAQCQYENAVPAQTDRWLSSSADGGATWGAPINTALLRFYVYGTATTD